MTNVRRKYQKIKDKYFTVDVHSGIEPRATRETYRAYQMVCSRRHILRSLLRYGRDDSNWHSEHLGKYARG